MTNLDINKITVLTAQTDEELYHAYRLHILHKQNEHQVIPVGSKEVEEIVLSTLTFLGVSFSCSVVDKFISPLDAKNVDDQCYVIDQAHSLTDLLCKLYCDHYPGQFFDLRVDKYKDESVLHNKPVIVSTSDNLLQALQFAILSERMLIVSDVIKHELIAAVRQVRSIVWSVSENFDASQLGNIFDSVNKYDIGATIGFLYPYGEIERELASLKSYLFAKFKKSEIERYNFFYPLEKYSEIISFGKTNFIIGPDHNADNLESVLKAPAEFMFALPHANGVDLSLGNVVLCPKLSSHIEAPANYNAMPCFYSNLCSRKRSKNKLMNPEEIKSVVVLLYTCWGVLLDKSSYDVSVSLSRTLMLSPFVACLISTYTSSLLDRSAGVYIGKQHAKNMSLGVNLKTYNENHYQRYQDDKDLLILFGDPEYTSNSNENLYDDSSFKQHFKSKDSLRKCGIFEVDECIKALPGYLNIDYFAKLEYTKCIVYGYKNAHNKTLSTYAHNLEKICDDLWYFAMFYSNRVLLDSREPAEIEKFSSHLQKNIVQFHRAWLSFYEQMIFSFGGYLRFQWDRYCYPALSEKLNGACPYCAGLLKSITSHLINDPLVKRTLIECVNCGTIVDGTQPIFPIVQTEDTWLIGDEHTIKIHIDSCNPLSLISLGCFIEPFQKGGLSNPISVNVSFKNSDANEYLLHVMTENVDSNLWPSGVYHLNVMLIMDVDIVVLRRNIKLAKKR